MKTNRKIIKAPLLSVCFIYAILLLGVASHTCLAQSAASFTATGSMTTGRYFQTATLLIDGKVLIAGGVGADSDDSQVTSELYDPAAGTFCRDGGWQWQGRLLR